VRFTLRVALLALSFGIGTWILGWWAIPLFSLGAAILARGVRYQALASAIAAAAAWGAFLVWSAIRGDVWSFASIAGSTMGVSGALLILLTLAFPAALAWSAAAATNLLAGGSFRRHSHGGAPKLGNRPEESPLQTDVGLLPRERAP
jgi:hypothetical protein